MSSITLTNIPAFVEQPGRTITKQIGELDRMTVPFLGPWNAQVPFQEGTPDNRYPLMFCMGYNEDDNGGLHELKVNYAGVAVTSGSAPYRTQPIVTVTPIEGSRDFEVEYVSQTGFVSTGTPGSANYNILYTYAVGTQRANVRYIGSSVVLRYQAIPKPDFETPFYQNLGLSLVEWEILSTYYGEVSLVSGAIGQSAVTNVLNSLHIPGIPPLFAAYLGMRMTQVGKWYDVEETYGPTF